MPPRTRKILALATLVFATPFSRAADQTWIATSPTDFSDPSAWETAIPSPTDTAVFNTDNASVNITQSTTNQSLRVDSGNLALNLHSDYTLAAGNSITVTNAGFGIYSDSSGSISAGDVSVTASAPSVWTNLFLDNISSAGFGNISFIPSGFGFLRADNSNIHARSLSLAANPAGLQTSIEAELQGGSLSIDHSFTISGSTAAPGGAVQSLINNLSINVADTASFGPNSNTFISNSTLTTGQLLISPDVSHFFWDGSSITVTQADVSIGPTGTLGPAFTISQTPNYAGPPGTFIRDKSLTVNHDTTIQSGGSLTIDGSFSTGSLNVAPGGTLNFIGGSISLIRSDLILDENSPFGPDLILSANQSLHISQTLRSNPAGFSVIDIAGGNLSAANVTAGTADLHIAGTAANPGSLTTTTLALGAGGRTTLSIAGHASVTAHYLLANADLASATSIVVTGPNAQLAVHDPYSYLAWFSDMQQHLVTIDQSYIDLGGHIDDPSFIPFDSYGSSSLNILNGARVSAGSLGIAQFLHSSASVLIDGPGSHFEGGVGIGRGNGSLRVQNGASVHGSFFDICGGTALITGTGTTVCADSFRPWGINNVAKFDLADSAALNTAQAWPRSNFQILIDHATWNITDSLSLMDSDDSTTALPASIKITNGATVNVSTVDFSLFPNAQNIDISVDHSSFNVSGPMILTGYYLNAHLTLQNGSTGSATDITIGPGGTMTLSDSTFTASTLTLLPGGLLDIGDGALLLAEDPSVLGAFLADDQIISSAANSDQSIMYAAVPGTSGYFLLALSPPSQTIPEPTALLLPISFLHLLRRPRRAGA
jgi:hypothetical protein